MSLELAPGAVIAGRYQLERNLGQGGMGTVWAATHTVTRKRLALKFLKGPAHLRPELRRRFLREARAASAVSHPNLLEVNDVFDLEDGTPVMVMARLEGETLGRRLTREGRLSVPDAADILIQVASGVGTAHAAGIVHRDLKPENVFLVAGVDVAASVRVLDFGIAKLVELDDLDEAGTITGTGSMLGTPCYMSPEQTFGQKDVDHRADVWSFGVMLYECLSGGRPVEGDSVGEVVKRLLSDGITPIEVLVPDLPADLRALVNRLLRRERDERPQDLREVSAVLGRYAKTRAPEFGPANSLETRDSGQQPVLSPPLSPAASADTEPSVPPGAETASTHALSSPTASRRTPLALWSVLGLAAAGATIVVVMRTGSNEQRAGNVPGASAPILQVAPTAVGASTAPATTTLATASALVASSSAIPAATTPPAPSGSVKPLPYHVIAATKPHPPVEAPPPATLAPSPASSPAPRVGGLAEKPPF